MHFALVAQVSNRRALSEFRVFKKGTDLRTKLQVLIRNDGRQMVSVGDSSLSRKIEPSASS